MCWLSSPGNYNKILHLRENDLKPWRPYTAFPQYAAPDYKIEGGSKGWATYQKLLKAGWVLIDSDTFGTLRERAHESTTQLSWNVID